MRTWFIALVALSCSAASEARGAPGGDAPEAARLTAQLVCPERQGKGRVVCELALTAPEGRLLRWADGLVVEAPKFALPLRARVTGKLPEGGASEVKIAVPLLATGEDDTGTLRLRARAVVCLRESCVTLAREVSCAVVVRRDPG